MGERDWFAPKRFGYGAGLPIAWQGWAALGGFTAVLIAAGLVLLPGHRGLFVAIALIAGAAFALLSAQHTRGGWKWRWGDDA